MDITALFKECLEALRQGNKDLALISPPEKGVASSQNAKPKIFPGRKSEYYSKARELSTTITSLRDYLVESRAAYLNISSGNASGHKSVFSTSGRSRNNVPSMSDVDRDMLDSDVQKIIHNCQKRILDYETVIETTESIQNNPNLKTHMENVAESLTTYLKDVTTVFSEMRAVRVKRTVDFQNMSRLSSLKTDNLKPSGIKRDRQNSVGDEDKKNDKRKGSAVSYEELDGPEPRKTPTADYFLDDEEIPPEELQVLEEENAALLNQLNSLAQEVDQIQSNVVQIAQLQEIFTEKVLQQEKEIDQIADVVVGATENIKGGNEQIRQAIQNNADFRAWILFFILVMSFSLLFLDWYND